ncbi:MAG: hypothetical protein ACI8QS_000583 [Planctomycetota bacterium]|jgi:hypothetical protein
MDLTLGRASITIRIAMRQMNLKAGRTLWGVVTLGLLACLAVSLAVSLACSEEALPEARQPVDARIFDLDGQPVDLFASADSVAEDRPVATVFIFTATDCPISNRYAPEIIRIIELFRHQGVNLQLVYADAVDDAEKVRRHLEEYAYPCGALLDLKHELVTVTGATITPEAVVYDRNQRLVYRGRISDRYVDFGVERRASSSNDLERVLTALVDRQVLEFESTKAVGCFIPELE